MFRHKQTTSNYMYSKQDLSLTKLSEEYPKQGSHVVWHIKRPISTHFVIFYVISPILFSIKLKNKGTKLITVHIIYADVNSVLTFTGSVIYNISEEHCF